eukprot:12478873-Heterocapsa_arctica.AAC.1
MEERHAHHEPPPERSAVERPWGPSQRQMAGQKHPRRAPEEGMWAGRRPSTGLSPLSEALPLAPSCQRA